MTQKRKICILVLLILLLVALAAVLFVQLRERAQNANPDAETIREYNAAITLAARKAGKISERDFILIDKITKEKGGNTDITIRVYRLAEGTQQEDYMHLRVSDLPEDFAPEYMGHGTARLLKGSLSQIVVSVTFVR